MNDYIQAVKSYIKKHKKDISTASPIILTAVFLIGVIMFATYASAPQIVYQPVKACDLLTPSEAQDLLGDKVISVDKNDPVISGDTATSKCSYTDRNPDQDSMIVAAVAIRSGINDKGIKQNKADFSASQSGKDTEAVKGLGDDAYFNKELGQLNILNDRQWIILNYGVGSAPETNTLNKAIDLAHKVLNKRS